MDGDALRAEGNRLFEAGQVAEAVALYRESLEQEKSAKTLGNLSLALLKLGSPQEALEAAEESLAADGAYVKAHDRKASAELALGKPWRARRTYQRALEVFAADKSLTPYLRKRFEEVRKAASDKDGTEPVESAEHFEEICKYMPKDAASQVSAVRLATMATFWNEAKAEDRLGIFVRFLQVLTGAENPIAGTNLSAEMLLALPMENYKDITIAAPWVSFFNGLERPAKIALFETMHESCTDIEKALIARDLQEFFPRQSGPGPASSAS